ncbi:MAG: VTT domain-containing protein [Pseudomonadota bacterium]
MQFLNLTPVLDWVAANPHWSGAAVFLISVAESLAIVGLFIPGTVVMFGVGALVAAGVMDLWVTLGLAAAGAIVGDGISYWLGYHYHERLRSMWPFSRYPQLFARGEAYFHRHGGKSVLLGRFVGPVRPIIPVVAGMLNMPPSRFLVVNVLSAIGWAPAYILPGVVFGASLGLASAVASRLAVLVVVLLLVLWFSVWAVRRVIRFLQPRTEVMLTRLLNWSRSHPLLGDLTATLVDPQHPESRGLLMWAGILVLAAWLFLGALDELVSGSPLVRADSAVFHLLQGLRTPWADQLMVFISQLGDVQVLLPLAVTVTLVLMWRRHWQAVLHWLAATAFGVLLTLALKHVLRTPGPVSLYQDLAGYSVPGAHVTLSMVIYGFLAVLIARELSIKNRWIPYALVSVLVVAITVSRLYLGVHWLSDGLGGLVLGLAWVALLGVAYRRHMPRALPERLLTATALATLLIAASWHISQHHARDVERYALSYTIRALGAQEWWERDWQTLPAYRVDLQGQPEQPLNVQWAGALSDLRAQLVAQGWREPVELNFNSALQWLVPQAELTQLPVLPQVHDGRHEALLLVYPLPAATRQESKRLVLRLWTADTVLRDDASTAVRPPRRMQRGAAHDNTAVSGTGLWVGNVTRQRLLTPLPALTIARSEAEMNAPLKFFQTMLNGLQWKIVQRTEPRTAAFSNWNGEVLLIHSMSLDKERK